MVLMTNDPVDLKAHEVDAVNLMRKALAGDKASLRTLFAFLQQFADQLEGITRPMLPERED